jgi:hypothetical protein
MGDPVLSLDALHNREEDLDVSSVSRPHPAAKRPAPFVKDYSHSHIQSSSNKIDTVMKKYINILVRA